MYTGSRSWRFDAVLSPMNFCSLHQMMLCLLKCMDKKGKQDATQEVLVVAEVSREKASSPSTPAEPIVPSLSFVLHTLKGHMNTVGTMETPVFHSRIDFLPFSSSGGTG